MIKIVFGFIWCAFLMRQVAACNNVLRLSFNDVYHGIVTDSSLRSNDGANNGCLQVTLGQQAARQMKCQPYVRLNTGFISLNGNHFHGKPRFAVTMATWLKLSWLPGRHEIFSTIGGKESTHTWGQYHFEVIQGKVRWFHRNEKKTTVFSVVTPAIIQANKWTHIAGTYDSQGGEARVYVNGKLVRQTKGSGHLSQDWGKYAGIGRNGLSGGDQRRLGGYLDEFNMYDCALTAEEVAVLYSKCT